MKGILSDNNIQRHGKVLRGILQSATWQDFWKEVDLPFLSLQELGLPPDVSDAVLWQTCETGEVILLTANRNQERPDSLEEALRTQNTPESLPVFTIASPEFKRKPRITTNISDLCRESDRC